MSQSQIFNLIHQWYHYIISSNTELFRWKENTLYMYSWTQHQKHNTASGINICLRISDRDNWRDNQRWTIQRHSQHSAHNKPDEDKQTIKTLKRQTQHRKVNKKMSNTDLTKNRGWTQILAVFLCNLVLSSQIWIQISIILRMTKHTLSIQSEHLNKHKFLLHAIHFVLFWFDYIE
jgi:hypothetical protein